MLLLAACRPSLEEACDAYVASLSACITEAYADEPSVRDATIAGIADTCLAYRGLKDRDAAEVLTCYAETLDGAPCASPDDYAQRLADLPACLDQEGSEARVSP